MKISQRKSILFLLFFTALILIQTVTYFTVGMRALGKELLPPHFRVNQACDTAYVRDFHLTAVNEERVFRSHDFRDHEDEIKQKLGSKFIYFQPSGNGPLPDSVIKERFSTAYFTWYSRDDWFTLFGLYDAHQSEFLIVNNHTYERQVTYKWILFFWVEKFEYIDSSDKIMYP